MLKNLLGAYKNVVRRLPSLGDINSNFPQGLDSAVEVLHLSLKASEVRGKALSLGLLLAVLCSIPALYSFDISAVFLALLLPGFASTLVLMVPLAAFRVKKARLTSDAVTFLLSFSTILQHANQEEAYLKSFRNLSSEEFEKAWVRLRLGELTSVEEVLSSLAAEMRPYSEQLYSAFRSAASEVQEEEPDYQALLRDSLSALQTENSIELNRFAEKFRSASVAISFTPMTLYLVLPFAAAFMGYNVNIAFFAASIAVVVIASGAVLYLVSVYPSSASFADLGSLDKEAARMMGVESGSLPTRPFVLAFVTMFLLSFLSPAFLLLLGSALLAFAAKNSSIPSFLDAVKKEMASLPLEMREISYRLRRGEPLEVALSASDSLAVRAIRFRSSRRVFPERTFSLVEDVIEHIKHSGDTLGATLEELRVFIREMLNYRNVMNAQMESVKSYMFLLYILLPVLSLFSLWTFSFMAEVSSEGADASSYFGFEGLSLISQPPDLELVLSFMSPAVVVSMIFFTLLSVLCEDVVAPQLLKAKTAMLGVGTFIMGLGEILLIGL